MNTPDPNSWDDPAWDDLFRQRLEGYEADPAPEALDRILTAVNGPTPDTKPGVGGRWWLLTAVGLLLLSGVGWLITEIRSIQPAEAGQAVQSPTNIDVATVLPTESERPYSTINELADTPATEPTGSQSAESRVVSPRPTTIDKPATKSESTVSLLTAGKPAAPNKPESAPRLLRSASGRAAVRRGNLVSDTYRPTGSGVSQSVFERTTGSRQTRSDPTVSPVTNSEFTGINLAPATTSPAEPASRADVMATSKLTIRPLRLLPSASQLPDVNPISMSAEAIIVRSARSRPGFYGSLMPLFTYRQISPVATDEVYVRSVQTSKALSTDRAGWQVQVGMEWPLTRQLTLRTGLTYSLMQQALTYNVSPTTPDSARVEVIDAQTIRVTPVRTDRATSETVRYHYAGVNANVVWHLTAGRGWRPYVTAGATVGGYVSPAWQTSGFVQASAGVERPLTQGTWLRVEPTVQYGWSPVTDAQNLFKIRPYTYGLTVGLGFR